MLARTWLVEAARATREARPARQGLLRDEARHGRSEGAAGFRQDCIMATRLID